MSPGGPNLRLRAALKSRTLIALLTTFRELIGFAPDKLREDLWRAETKLRRADEHQPGLLI